MERYLGSLERLLLPVLAALLAFITIGVFIQVVLRYVFATSFLWGEELSLFAFIWCVFLGSSVCSWRRTHFAFDLFEDRLKGRVAAAQRLLVNLAVLTVTVVMVVTGWQFSQLSVQRLSPALGITLLVPTIVMPLAGVLMSLSTLADIARDLRVLWFGGDRPSPNPS